MPLAPEPLVLQDHRSPTITADTIKPTQLRHMTIESTTLPASVAALPTPSLISVRISRWWWALAAVLGLRLVSMLTIPLTDTSEPRYAEIARLMAATGDWITPWFEPGKPFWGKPPLSFWAEAASFRVLGTSDFAARFPSWLATLAMLPLIFVLAKTYANPRAARLSLVIFCTCLLSYVVAGAVLTDPFLAFGTTLCMTSFVLAPQRRQWYWRYGFFIGLVIGLLAKGPLALVLVGGAVVPWMAWHRNARRYLSALPWFKGTLIVAALVVPWYAAAELKTPGFLDYFIVGEHIRRFIDPGWTGDLYGNAHKRPLGSIWAFWIMAAFPWSLIAVGIVLRQFSQKSGRTGLRLAMLCPLTTYLLAWTVFTLIFFTVARNVLWTYVLPGIPAFSILLGKHIDRCWVGRHRSSIALAAMLVIPGLMLVIAAVVARQPTRLKTERDLVAYAQALARDGEPLFFVDSRPFSARYYSRGQAGLVSMENLPALLAHATTNIYLAVPTEELGDVEALLPRPSKPKFRSLRYALVSIPR
jgi:4-amino-4-deoxy-L-arabinose transferase-like glycosyltransferase